MSRTIVPVAALTLLATAACSHDVTVKGKGGQQDQLLFPVSDGGGRADGGFRGDVATVELGDANGETEEGMDLRGGDSPPTGDILLTDGTDSEETSPPVLRVVSGACKGGLTQMSNEKKRLHEHFHISSPKLDNSSGLALGDVDGVGRLPRQLGTYPANLESACIPHHPRNRGGIVAYRG